ncbi:cold-shock protein [Fulvivirgaceae bacterium BMA12]|uniref:Cold-shock protein n=1 Tax=Agaribacillus aureus TaxID=3051825 RepID=A0ABT8LDM7_9BACT|nr:cold-shock protein [Fulvivirgaceae bacterium BMA12]
MARSNNSFIKKQKADNKRKKRLEKLEKKQNKTKDPSAGSLDNMIVYVDEEGNFTSEPPEQKKNNE